MSNVALRFVTVAVVAIALTACGKSADQNAKPAPQSTGTPTAQAQARIYGTEDGQCFAGIVKAVDAKHMTSADYHKWIDKLNDNDKIWITGFSDFYSKSVRVANAHMGNSPKQLYDSKLITINQLNVLEGYVNVYQESDSLKAGALSAGACVKVGFGKGTDLS